VDIKKSSNGSTIVKPDTSSNKKAQEMRPTVLTDDSDEIGSLMPFMDETPSPEPADMDLDSSIVTPTNDVPHPVDSAKVSMIAWSANDRWCFVASNHGEIRVYYAYNGEMACILKGHEGEIYALDNHPLDSSTILSAGYDGKVILWDVEKQKVITCRNHVGRTFTDCKFSKDAMKYAITDEEGHCTLFGIGGLDYEQVRSWERGQYFMSDYQALRHFADGSFLDEPTQQQPYVLLPSPIIDLQGVAYPNQKKFGYGKTNNIK
jgi:WD40 repeat protein